MSQTSSPIPAVAVRGVASGVLFMAFFGTLWATIGIGGLQGSGSPWLAILAVLIGIIQLGGSISLFLASRHLSNEVSQADARQGRHMGIWFGIIFTTEVIFIVIASWICNAINRFDLFFPIMAIIVGIHFLPLAALFRIKAYYFVGVLLCLLAIITLVIVPESAKLDGQQITAQWVVIGFGAALILWGVGLGLWLLGKRWLDLAESQKQVSPSQ
jgi:hypothetical protein